jgi:cytochrome c
MLARQSLVKCIFIYTALAASTANGHANSADQKAFILAKQNACLGCHAIDKKIVGPSFESVAQKYKSDSSAQTFLKNKIAKGGSGSWGVVPMPANAKLNEADLSLLASWVLRGAPTQD